MQNLAEVSVNGVPLGVLWKKPFRADMTGALKPGSNTIEVKVTNLWVNRMIGDRQPDAPKQFTFTRPVVYKANSPLLPSGLLGPVKVVQVSDRQVGTAADSCGGRRFTPLQIRTTHVGQGFSPANP